MRFDIWSKTASFSSVSGHEITYLTVFSVVLSEIQLIEERMSVRFQRRINGKIKEIIFSGFFM